MIRRCWLAVAGLTLAMAGCESVMVAAQRGEPVWLLHRLDWTVDQPSHRVALATLEVLEGELAEAKLDDFELTRDDQYASPDAKIPDDEPAFRLEHFEAGGPAIVTCRSADFEGKTKDGRIVFVVVRLEITGADRRTVVSVQVGRRRDDKASKDLIDKISAKVHQPTLRPGSPEEQGALDAAFGARSDFVAKKG